MREGPYVLQVHVSGQGVPEYSDEASGLAWICAEKGQEFTVYVRNDSDRDVAAVVTVDGLSVVDGKPGSYRSVAYSVRAHESRVIPGWRLDMDNVAKFEFGSMPECYAHQIEQSLDNVGVIGCAIFPESAEPPSVLYQTEDVGVKFGQRAPNHVEWGHFERESDEPAAVLRIRYDTRTGLVRRTSMCQPPDGWTGE